MPGYHEFETRLSAWAKERSDVRAVIAVGSRALDPSGPDLWADLDLIVYSQSTFPFLQEPSWLSELGEVWFHYFHHTFAGDPEWMVWFEPGVKVDVIVAEERGDLGQALRSSPYAPVFRQGTRLIYQAGKNNIEASLQTRAGDRMPPPLTEERFKLLCQAVLHLAGKVALLLRRGDRWRAKILCDGELKVQLANLIGWHASSGQASALQPGWMSQRHLESWADPRLVAMLPQSFASYDLTDLWRALFASLELYRAARDEIAGRNGWVISSGERAFLVWLNELAARE